MLVCACQVVFFYDEERIALNKYKLQSINSTKRFSHLLVSRTTRNSISRPILRADKLILDKHSLRRKRKANSANSITPLQCCGLIKYTMRLFEKSGYNERRVMSHIHSGHIYQIRGRKARGSTRNIMHLR